MSTKSIRRLRKKVKIEVVNSPRKRKVVNSPRKRNSPQKVKVETKSDKDIINEADWRIVWNPKKYKALDRYNQAKKKFVDIYQFEGCNFEHQKRVPFVNETVVVIWDGLCWLHGKVLKTFTEHNKGNDKYNLYPSSIKSHRCRRSGKIRIKSFDKPIPVRGSGQGTWAYMKDKPSLLL